MRRRTARLSPIWPSVRFGADAAPLSWTAAQAALPLDRVQMVLMCMQSERDGYRVHTEKTHTIEGAKRETRNDAFLRAELVKPTERNTIHT